MIYKNIELEMLGRERAYLVMKKIIVSKDNLGNEGNVYEKWIKEVVDRALGS